MTLIKKKKLQENKKTASIKQMVENVKKDNPEFKENNNFEKTLSKLIKVKPKNDSK
jgi:hypothetical protein